MHFEIRKSIGRTIRHSVVAAALLPAVVLGVRPESKTSIADLAMNRDMAAVRSLVKQGVRGEFALMRQLVFGTDRDNVPSNGTTSMKCPYLPVF
jgi:hypothetical protein